MKGPYYIKEYGTICVGNSNNDFESGKLEIDSESFKFLTNFIEENENQDDFEKAFSISQKKGIRYINVKKAGKKNFL